MKTALVFGSSGLVGSHVLNQLIQHSNYSKIKLFVRSSIKVNDRKIELIQTDFNNLEQHREEMMGDECFFCIGNLNVLFVFSTFAMFNPFFNRKLNVLIAFLFVVPF